MNYRNLTIKIGNLDKIDASITELDDVIQTGRVGMASMGHLSDIRSILLALKRAADDPGAKNKKDSDPETIDVLWDSLEAIVGIPPEGSQTLCNYAGNAEAVVEKLRLELKRMAEWQHQSDLDSLKVWNARVSDIQNKLTAALRDELAEKNKMLLEFRAQRDEAVMLLGKKDIAATHEFLERLGKTARADEALVNLHVVPPAPDLTAIQRLIALRPEARELKHQRISEAEYHALPEEVRAYFTLMDADEQEPMTDAAGVDMSDKLRGGAWTWSVPADDNDTVRGSTKDGWAATVQSVAGKGSHVTVTLKETLVVYRSPVRNRDHGMLTALNTRQEALKKNLDAGPVNYPLDGIKPVSQEEYLKRHPENAGMFDKLKESCGPRLHGEHIRESITTEQVSLLGPMATKAKGRPADFDSLPPDVQWSIDRDLGILDWDGSSHT